MFFKIIAYLCGSCATGTSGLAQAADSAAKSADRKQ